MTEGGNTFRDKVMIMLDLPTTATDYEALAKITHYRGIAEINTQFVPYQEAVADLVSPSHQGRLPHVFQQNKGPHKAPSMSCNLCGENYFSSLHEHEFAAHKLSPRDCDACGQKRNHEWHWGAQVNVSAPS